MPTISPQSGFGYALALATGWRRIIALAIGGAISAFSVELFLPNWYTASTSFVVENRSSSGRIPTSIAGLATQFGIAVSTEPARSPDFYAALLVSEPVVGTILSTRFADPATSDSSRLVDLLRVPDGTANQRLEKGRRKLINLMSVQVDPKTSIITLKVDARDPALAAVVGNQFVKELTRFDIEVRQSQAKARRDFAAKEGEKIHADLLLAEDSLRRFYERNRQYQSSPALVFEEGRLRRQVDLHQELYLSMARELETARVEAVNDASSITILAAAQPPSRKSRPHRLAGPVAAALLGAALGIVTLVLSYRMRVLEDHTPGALGLFRSAFAGRPAKGTQP